MLVKLVLVAKPIKGSFSVTAISNQIKSQDNKDIEIYNLKEQLIKANGTIHSLESEVSHLKQMLDAVTPQIGGATKLMPSDEEIIADIQLSKLKAAAMERTLSLDECRALDLLVKTKKIAKGEASDIIDHKGLPKNMSQGDLLKIASKKIKS